MSTWKEYNKAIDWFCLMVIIEIAVISILFLMTGCEVVNGLRIANNPNNYNGQWNHDPCHSQLK
jgi:hypothetical protein